MDRILSALGVMRSFIFYYGGEALRCLSPLSGTYSRLNIYDFDCEVMQQELDKAACLNQFFGKSIKMEGQNWSSSMLFTHCLDAIATITRIIITITIHQHRNSSPPSSHPCPPTITIHELILNSQYGQFLYI